jgi:hypothetical protein
MQGQWQDFEVLPDGTERLLDEGDNLVLNGVRTVMAMCMKQDPSFGGFLWWAVGVGDGPTSSWDAGVASGTNAPAKTDTHLRQEVYRKAILPGDIVFLDSAGNVSATPTNQLQITVTFMESEPDSPSPRRCASGASSGATPRAYRARESSSTARSTSVTTRARFRA